MGALQVPTMTDNHHTYQTLRNTVEIEEGGPVLQTPQVINGRQAKAGLRINFPGDAFDAEAEHIDYAAVSEKLQGDTSTSDMVKFASDGGCIVNTTLGQFQIAPDKIKVPEMFKTGANQETREIFVEKNVYETQRVDVNFIQYVHEIKPVPVRIQVEKLHKVETDYNYTVQTKKLTPKVTKRTVAIPQGVRTTEVPIEVQMSYPPEVKYEEKTISVSKNTIIEKPIIKENIVEVPYEVERPVEVIKENYIYRKVPKFNFIDREISMSQYNAIKKSIEEDRLAVAQKRLLEEKQVVTEAHEFDIDDECEVDIEVEPQMKEDWQLNESMMNAGVSCCSVSPVLEHSRRVIRVLEEPQMKDYYVTGDDDPTLITRAGKVPLSQFSGSGLNEFLVPPFKNDVSDLPVDEDGIPILKKAFEQELGNTVSLTDSMVDDVRRRKRQGHRDMEETD